LKILLDNCVDWRASRLIVGHDVSHTRNLGWETLSNGRLLAAAASAGFVAIVTVDKKIKYEQNLQTLPVTVIEIDTSDSRLPAIAAITSQLNHAITLIERWRFISIDQTGRITMTVERLP
jgi:hypothetical protein